MNFKQDYQMFYLSFTTDFGLRIDRTAHTLHGNCFRALVGFGAVLIINSMYRAEVD